MEFLKGVFVALALLNMISSLVRLLAEEEGKEFSFSAAAGWFCAIFWAFI